VRTTLNIDDDVLRVAKELAREGEVSVGRVVSELARRGLQQARFTEQEDGIPSFTVSEAAPTFTGEDVRRAEEDQ
jgi:hypothetical protein